MNQVLDEIGVTLDADMVGVPGKEAAAAKQARHPTLRSLKMQALGGVCVASSGWRAVFGCCQGGRCMLRCQALLVHRALGPCQQQAHGLAWAAGRA